MQLGDGTSMSSKQTSRRPVNRGSFAPRAEIIILAIAAVVALAIIFGGIRITGPIWIDFGL